MPKIRRILKHVEVEIARGNRRCRRNRQHQIPAGTPCLVIQDDSGPFKRSYCRECALPILKQCAADLRHFRDVLYGSPSQQQQQQSIPASSPLGQALLDANSRRRKSRRPAMQVTAYDEKDPAGTKLTGTRS